MKFRITRSGLGMTSMLSMVATEQAGEVATESYRMFFKDGSSNISPWHDIPLKDGDLFNFVNEIPKYTKAKMEVATKEVISYLLDCYYIRYIDIYTHIYSLTIIS